MRKQKKFRSIKWGWILFISLGVLIAVLSTVAMNYTQLNKILTNDHEQNAKDEANNAVNQISLGLEKYEMALQQLSDTVEVNITNDKTLANVDMLVNSLQTENDEYLAVYFMDFRTGKIHMYPKIEYEWDVRDSQTYKVILENKKLTWMDVYLDTGVNKLMTSVLAPVTINNEIVGAVGFDLDFSTIGKIREQIENNSNTKLMILDKKGLIVSSFIENQDGTNMNPAMSGQIEGVQDIDNSIFAKSLDWVTKSYDKKDMPITELEVQDHTYSGQLLTMPMNDWKVMALKDDAIFDKKMSSFNMITFISFIIGIAIGVVVAVLLAKKLISIVKNFGKVIDQTAQGDLNVQFDNSPNNEIGQLEQSYNNMLEHMRALLEQVNKNTNTLRQVSNNVSNIAFENKESLVEVSTAIDEIANSASHQSEKMNDAEQVLAYLAQEMDQLKNQTVEMDSESHEANTHIQAGFTKVEELQHSYTNLEQSFAKVTTMMLALSEKSKTISDVTHVIAKITDQTNLLALNASIEAARAGEHGKGFAVVADEVRKLAESSKEATTNIQTILTSVLNDTHSLVDVIEQTNEMSDMQKQAVTKVYEVIDELSQSVGKMSTVIQQTSQKMNEMNTTKEQVVDIINEVSNLSSEVTASTEEMASAVAEQTTATGELVHYTNQLNDQAETLQHSVDHFKL